MLQEVFEETHGVMVFQEQVMRILNRLGQIDLASAYTCIKAISKKKESMIAENREQFLRGAQATGLRAADADELWQMILKFAGYGFNKSHSTAYALLAYQTAFLKRIIPSSSWRRCSRATSTGATYRRRIRWPSTSTTAGG